MKQVSGLGIIPGSSRSGRVQAPDFPSRYTDNTEKHLRAMEGDNDK